MAKRMLQDPELLKAFKEYADALGGSQCSQWNQIYNYLQKEYNFKLRSPQSLKQVYESLFIKGRELEADEVTFVLNAAIKTNFNWGASMEIVSQKLDLTRMQCRNHCVKYLKKALQVFVNILFLKKDYGIRKTQRFHFSSITIMTNLSSSTDNDRIIQEIKEYSIIFRNLLLVFAENIVSVVENRGKFYEIISKICCRRQFAKIMFYIEYIHQLKQIFLDSQYLQNNVIFHPLLKQPLELNKQLLIYKKYIDISDYNRKFTLYNQVMADATMQEICQEPPPKLKSGLKESKFIKKAKPRPRFGISKKIAYRDPNTIMFLTEDDKYEEKQPIDKIKSKNQTLNQLYEAAFEFELYKESGQQSD